MVFNPSTSSRDWGIKTHWHPSWAYEASQHETPCEGQGLVSLAAESKCQMAVACPMTTGIRDTLFPWQSGPRTDGPIQFVAHRVFARHSSPGLASSNVECGAECVLLHNPITRAWVAASVGVRNLSLGCNSHPPRLTCTADRHSRSPTSPSAPAGLGKNHPMRAPCDGPTGPGHRMFRYQL